MIRRPPRSTPLYSSAASDVYKRQGQLVRGDVVGDRGAPHLAVRAGGLEVGPIAAHAQRDPLAQVPGVHGAGVDVAEPPYQRLEPLGFAGAEVEVLQPLP